MASRSYSQARRRAANGGLLRGLLVLAGVAFMGAVFGVILAQFSPDPTFALTTASLVVLFPFVWRYPQLGLYVLVAAAASIETFRLRFPDSITDVVPFFRSLDSLGSPLPIPFSPGEILLIGTLGILMAKRLVARNDRLEGGPLLVPLALLVGLTLFGVLRGLGSGGDLSAAVFEARAHIYFAGIALLAYNLIRSRGRLRLVLWVLLGAIAFKGVLGMWRFLITLEGDLERARAVSPNTNALFSHEESAFFAFFVLFFFAAFLFRTAKAERVFCAVFMLPVVLSLLASERRAGIAVLLLGLVIIALAALVFEPTRRKLIISVGVVVLLLFPPYLVAFSENPGILGQPARAVTSIFEPDERDLSSNQYRVIEYNNVSRTIMQSPVVGLGYGVPFTMYEPMPDISDDFEFWDIVPHNSLLWVWLRLGVIGVVVFWLVIGRTIIGALLTSRASPDRYLRAMGALTAAAIVGWLFMGAVDMGLTNIRLSILAGALAGMVVRLPVPTSSSMPSREGHLADASRRHGSPVAPA